METIVSNHLGASNIQNLPTGSVVAGLYRVEERLGVGGQAAVYRASPLDAGGTGFPGDERIALKIVSTVGNDDGDTVLDRIRSEYSLLSKLTHPNIVQVYNFGLLGANGCFIAMEYVDGITLAERISNVFGPLPFEEILHILREIALGLECAHSAAVIHRDLKPANIMLSSYGEIKILDFGLARDMDLGKTMTKTGETIGTPYYMSPEQFTRLSALDERVDIYAFGMIAYELVAGKPPFKDGAYHEIAYSHLRNPVPPLESKHYKLPPWFYPFICVCTEKKPENRPQSMKEVIEFIEQEMAKMRIIPHTQSSDPRWINWLWDLVWRGR